jgi:polysaccharide biosynthesis transport protein
MDSTLDTGLNPVELVRSLRTHVRWLVVPAVACGVIAAAYSLVASRDWRATQALIVRPEVASVSNEQIGKFSDLSEMKTLQETIFELAKSHSVVEATLKEVGPTGFWFFPPKNFPTLADVEDFRDRIDMRPPGGAEFGKTEVFYLSILDTNRDRASALAAALCGQLERRMQELRDQRAQGMIAELGKTVAMADADLAAKTKELSTFEAKVGFELAELRNLNANNSGQSEVSQVLQGIEADRRANDATRRENRQLLKVLKLAQDDPQQLLATPSSLLRSQPAVSRLKDALVDAQVYSANLLASKSEKHPYVIAAREAEALLQQKLHDEVAVAIKGIEIELAMNADREESLVSRGDAGRDRMSRLAGERAEYANLVAAVENHTKLVDAARKNLSDARARQAGAHSSNVISRIDGVEAGVRPVGLSRKSITAAGGFGGLVLGLGFVFLFAKPVPAKVVSNSPAPSAVANGEPVKTVASANGSNGKTAKSSGRDFGLYHGLSLDEAIRKVEQRFSGKSGW